MKTLQEKAKEYAKKECNYNVDCDANSSCEGCQWLNNSITENQMRNSSKGFIDGYQAAKYETRWRSVEEELPETNNFGNGISAEVLCYVPDVHKVLRYSKNKFYPNGAWFNLSEELQQYPTHWKPIE